MGALLAVRAVSQTCSYEIPRATPANAHHRVRMLMERSNLSALTLMLPTAPNLQYIGLLLGMCTYFRNIPKSQMTGQKPAHLGNAIVRGCCKDAAVEWSKSDVKNPSIVTCQRRGTCFCIARIVLHCMRNFACMKAVLKLDLCLKDAGHSRQATEASRSRAMEY